MAANSRTIRGMDVEDTGGDGSEAPPLVLLHGWLDSRKTWSRVLPLLQPGRRVVAVTLRGWGDAAKEGEYSIDAYAADVVALLDALSIPKAVLGGHSMGTLVSSAVAARAPERVAAMLLCGAAPTMRRAHVLDPSDGTTCADIGPLCTGWTAAGAPDNAMLESFQLDDLRPYVDAGTMPQAFADQVMEETLKADLRAYGEAWCSMVDEDHSGELASIAAPVLIVWGTADGVFVEEDQLALVEALPAASVTRENVEGAPHGVIWTHPSEVAAAVNGFLQTWRL